MKIYQKGFTSATMALLGFTIIVGIWFLWTHSLTDIRNGVKDLSLPEGNGEQISKPVAKTAPVINQTVPKQTPQTQTEIQTANKPIADDTINWQVYCNDQYGFEIKYPENFFAREDESGVISIIGNQYKKQQFDFPAIYISPIITDLAPQQYFEKNEKKFGPSLFNKTETTIGPDKISVVQFSSSSTTGDFSDETLVGANKGLILEIERHSYGRDKGEFPLEIYNQMLAAFKPIAVQANGGNFTGTYLYSDSYGDNGQLKVAQKSDSAIEFSLDINITNGNMGDIYKTTAKISGNTATYENQMEYEDEICAFQIWFGNGVALIQGMDIGSAGETSCGFGAGVVADGIYIKDDNKIPALSMP